MSAPTMSQAGHSYREKRRAGACRVCGCTDEDCRQCIERTGRPCYWVEDDLCSACESENEPESREDVDIPDGEEDR